MALVAGRWWRWLRGAGPLEILPAGPLPAVLAWLLALALTWGVDAASPRAPVLTHAALALAVEALLAAAVLLAAHRRHLLSQMLQAAGLLAGLRNAILAPVLALLLADRAQVGPGTILVLFVVVALVTVVAMAWLVGRYLALWRQALRVRRGAAAAVLLGLALALLLAESVLARVAPSAAPPPSTADAGAAGAGLR